MIRLLPFCALAVHGPSSCSGRFVDPVGHRCMADRLGRDPVVRIHPIEQTKVLVKFVFIAQAAN